ncbi:hypothetical protein BGZ65_003523 [Modicella reniformis]|uniref:Uncharacterized protein n=1 Tax=Modicella reniformis TaxID=1440133 RepID=A0A9P6IZN0_9FUNG|nr:hypothetical protein BGZ65_003523 [Modicella reniformis]
MVIASVVNNDYNLRPLSPPPIGPLPFAPSKATSPPISPSSPKNRMNPLIPPGLQRKQLDILDLIPDRDQSLSTQQEQEQQQQQQQEQQEEEEQQLQQEHRRQQEQQQQQQENEEEESKESAKQAEDDEEYQWDGLNDEQWQLQKVLQEQQLRYRRQLEGDMPDTATFRGSIMTRASIMTRETIMIGLDLGPEEFEDMFAGMYGENGNPDVPEWLPTLLEQSFATSKISLENLGQPPAPRERVFTKGWYNGSQNEEGMVSPQDFLSSIPEDDDKADKTDMHTIEIQLSSTSFELPRSHEYQQLLQDQYGVQNPSLSSPTLAESTSSSSVELQNLAAASSTSLNSSVSSTSSAKSRMSISMQSFGNGPDNKRRSSGGWDNHYNSNTTIQGKKQGNGSGSAGTTGNQHHNSGREWTIQDVISQDPFASIKPPHPPSDFDPPPADHFLRCFWFIHRLEQTMTSGGFLSQKLYVPKLVWHQKGVVRLPAIEAKINACHTLSQLLDRLLAQSKSGKIVLLVEMGGHVEKTEMERQKVLKELESFELATLEQWTKLSKKMSFILRPGKGPGGATGVGIGSNGSNAASSGYRPMHNYQHSDHQYSPYHHHRPPHHYQDHRDDHGSGPYDWLKSDDPISATLKFETMSHATLSTGTMSAGTISTGLISSSTLTSSSVSEKGGSTMTSSSAKRTTADLVTQWKNFQKNVQKTIVNEKIEDTTPYTEALIQLFKSSYLIETMLKHFEELPPHQTHIKIIDRLQRICDFYNMVVCAFVIRDMGELMLKYAKRMGNSAAE